MRKRPIPTRRFIKPSFTSLIEKKRDGQEFTQEEIRYIIDSTLDGEMPQHQQADLLMATTTEGELVVARRDPAKFDLIKRYTIAESPVWAHPVPVGQGVLIKDADTVAYWVF